MVDMLKTIVPKSDQMNFDDFLGGVTKTIKITKVSGSDGDQPISIHFEGDNGKPYKPCKSMRRALVALWGGDGSKYTGKSMTLYGDPEVAFGGVKVGGIRISHVSDIDEPHVLALTAKKGGKKAFTVRPLKTETKAAPTEAEKLAAAKKKADAIIAEILAAEDVKEVVEKHKDALERFEKAYPDLSAAINDALKLHAKEGE